MRCIIRFTQVARRTGERRPAWIKSVSFADGPGYRIKSMILTPRRDEAASFAPATAQEIAAQYFRSPASLEKPNGAPLDAETTALRAEQARRLEQFNSNREDINNTLAEIDPLGILDRI